MADNIANNDIAVGPNLTTPLNQAPYWDDFDHLKNFYRLLAVPGRALQARELTQTQSMLQNQIDYLTGHIFKEGSRVRGGTFHVDLNLPYIKIADHNNFGNTVFVDNYLDTRIVGSSSGVAAVVVNVANGSEAEDPDTKTLFVKYVSASADDANTVTLTPGEQFTSNNGFSGIVLSANTSVGIGSQFTIDTGVIYAHDTLIRHDRQTVLLDKYGNRPTCRVGFVIDEEIITENDDATLYDNALGTPNETAPGMHRLKITPVLTKTTANTNPDAFYELFQIKNGVIQEIFERSQYADLRDEMARRTYDESGDYVVRGLAVRVREHLNNGENFGLYTLAEGGNTNLLAIGIEPGTAYIHGYDYENLVTRYLEIEKGIDFKDVEQIQVPANFGNYAIVNEFCGAWAINTGDLVDLYDTAQTRVSSRDYSGSAVSGNKLGTARVKAIQWDEGTIGTPNCKYRVYLYDINMTANAFSYCRSIYYDQASLADSFADFVLSSNSAILNETGFRSTVFNLPVESTRRIRDENGLVDTTLRFVKSFNATCSSGGTFSISTGLSDEIFPFSTGVLNDTQVRDNFVVVTNGGVNATLSGTATFSTGSNTVTGSGTSFASQLHVGEKLKNTSGTTGIMRIVAIANNTSLTVNPRPLANATANTIVKPYVAGETLDFTTTGADAGDRSVIINTTTSALFDLSEALDSTVSVTVHTNLSKTDAREARKIRHASKLVKINTLTHPNSTSGPWCLGLADVFRLNSVRAKTSDFASTTEGTDVTANFQFDNGMRDGFYGLAYLKLKPGQDDLATGTRLLVNVDYFTHDYSQGVGYLSVDSYPIDDVNSANTQAIETFQIPFYVPEVVGNIVDLRDALDARPIMTNTATDAGTLGAASTNPSANSTFQTSAGAIYTLAPNENMALDMSYYLPRNDLVVVDKRGNYGVIRGVPTSTPYTPQTPSDSTPLGVVYVKPYPSLSPDVAKSNRRQDLATTTSQIKIRRYTMRDIGVLDQRITNLEYYTSLSILEKNTADMKILDEDGLDRFKNGILAEPFTGHSVGDVNDVDYRCAVDIERTQLRPRFSLTNLPIDYDEGASTNIYRTAQDVRLTLADDDIQFSTGDIVYQGATIGTATATGVVRFVVGARLYVEQVTGTWNASLNVKGGSANTVVNLVERQAKGNILTLPYAHAIAIEQPYAVTTRNAAGLFWNWQGQVLLDPNSDFWTEQTIGAVQSTDLPGDLGNWNANTGWETEWGSWERRWTSKRRANPGETINLRPQDIDNLRNQINGVIARRGGFAGMSKAGKAEFLSTIEQMGFTRKGNKVVYVGDGTLVLPPNELGPGGRRNNLLNSVQVTTSGFERTGIQTVTSGSSQETTGQSGVLDVSLIPTIRSKIIKVTGKGFKPNARLYAFFDGEDVNTYCTPTNSTFTLDNSEGAPLIVDASGEIYLRFRIPNNNTLRFTVGQRIFRLSDSPTNSEVVGQVTTAGQAEYNAAGIAASRAPQQQTITDTRQVTTLRVDNWHDITSIFGIDPIAQTFSITPPDATAQSEAAYVTKVDLYFATKDATHGCVIELRELAAAGQVASSVLPYARCVLAPGDINISSDSSTPTPCVFPAPVAVTTNKEYALVVKPLGNNPNITLWISQLGKIDILTEAAITKQPYTGVLLASSNDGTWTPFQDEDLKMTVYVAQFNTGVVGNAKFANPDQEYFTVANVSSSFNFIGEEVQGEARITISGSVANTGEYIFGTTSHANAIVMSTSDSTHRVRGLPIGTHYANGENVTFKFANGQSTGGSGTVSSQYTPTGDTFYYDKRDPNRIYLHLANSNTGSFVVGEQLRGQTTNCTATIVTMPRLRETSIFLEMGEQIYPEAHINWAIKTASNTAILGNTNRHNQTSTAFNAIVSSVTSDFDSERAVYGHSAEATLLSGEKSLQLKGEFVSENPFLSPTVDISRTYSFIIGNEVNNLSTGETGISGGNAHARYITTNMNLADFQDAEDMKVLITAYKPAGTEIKLYFKAIHGEDSDTLEEVNWKEFEQATSSSVISSSENQNSFLEYEYNFPAEVLTGPNGEYQYVNSQGITFTSYKHFKIKVVLLADNTALVPRLDDLRAICLQK